jgi:hypothetical protein
MSAIKEVLHRRSDLATFVVHFTRRTQTSTAEENLVQMLVGGCIEARTAMGWARGVAERSGPAASDSQKVACFSEAPLEHLYSLTADIDGRRIALEPYGIAFTKVVARRKGANPVWYVDMSYGHDWKLARALDQLRDDLVSRATAEGSGSFRDHPAAALLPFYEGMGTWASRQKEFWWEREWRKAGNFAFESKDVALIVAPEDTHATLRRHFARPVIDAAWGLERMIASLANVPMTDVTPFS